MSYRHDDRPPLKPEDVLPRFEVRNGSVVKIAFPCYYLDVNLSHDSSDHDYRGWPGPDKPDTICQQPFHGRTGEWEWIDFWNPHPIALTSDYEGYDEVRVVRDDDNAGLVMDAYIDDDEPNVIYLRVYAHLDFFEDKPKEFRFTLLAHAPRRTYDGKLQHEKLDQVIRGIMVVLPGDNGLE